MAELAACTIVSKNYLAFARVLAGSFLARQPGARFFVLLVDRVDGCFDPAGEPFTLLDAEELGRACGLDMASFLFKYSLLEANTAVKPYFLAHLLRRYDLERLVYFDPDILVLGDLGPLAEVLGRRSLALTPHLTSPIDDGMVPGERQILQAGTYNLGFIGLGRTPLTERFLEWWQQRVFDRCVVRPDQGLFVDQKWIDLVPGLFPDVEILTAPGYNVAYWNLHGRTVTLDGEPRVNGEPLTFFHFSGIQLDALDLVSKYQDRFRLDELGGAAELYRRYRDLLLAAGHRACSAWPYAFGRFANGVAIPDLARALYLSLGSARQPFGDPFATGPGSFYEWLNRPQGGGRARVPYLSRLLHHLYQQRPELLRRFPRVETADLPDFAHWVREFGRFEHRLDDVFVAPVAVSRPLAPGLAGLPQRLRHTAKRALRSPPARRVKRELKRLLGAERTQTLRRRLGQVDELPQGVEALRGGRLGLPLALERPGFSLAGYLKAETGMGEGARSLLRALATTGLPFAHRDLDLNVLARREDDSVARDGSAAGPFDINLLFVNADQVPQVAAHLGADLFAGRYNIGFWLWELETFPERWRSSFRPFHEIWTPSSFCLEALSAVAPIPVRRVPLAVEAPPRRHDRGHFGLPEGAFLVLFLFDFLSVWERKNPLAVVRAFRRAFPRPGEAVLVLKSAGSEHDPEGRERLRRELPEGAIWIDRYLSRQETWDLLAAADAYVSLHRSEGFGLTLAEAMALGRPVVATPYSGPADFFDLNTGWPVRHTLTTLDRDHGPYRAGARWAEPDVDHAAALLREIFADPAAAATRAARGRRRVEETLGPAAVGEVLERRYREILRLVDGWPG